MQRLKVLTRIKKQQYSDTPTLPNYRISGDFWKAR